MPTNTEWTDLATTAGDGTYRCVTGNEVCFWEGAGTKLKSQTDWRFNGNGTDDFGFTALPGGYREDSGQGNVFTALGNMAAWWSAYPATGTTQFIWAMNFGDGDMMRTTSKSFSILRSIRCVQD
jgi:uncharacterized protein (TIGR02145 family)